MKCDFSETQFAFCLTFEILRKYKTLKMPQFPNTVQEGRFGGYDVMIDGSIFIQFKIPEYLKKSKKYQVKINTESKQHSLLKNLKKPANFVYYAAPEFHLHAMLEEYYNENKLEENTIFFPIEGFPDDNEIHTKLTYVHLINDTHCGILHSTAKYISMTRKILSCDSSTYQPDRMKLTKKAEFILQFIKEIDSSVNIRYDNENIIDEVFSILLIRYNIIWIPFLDP